MALVPGINQGALNPCIVSGVLKRKQNFCVILVTAFMLEYLVNILSGESMILSETDYGRTVEISVGDQLEIILSGNPTTGYVWELVSLDVNRLSLGQVEFFANNKTPGSVGMEIIKLHALAAGTSLVRLIFHRPFEQNLPPLKTFEVNLVIKKLSPG